LSGTDLHKLYQTHINYPGRLATLLVRHRQGNRFLLFDHKQQLCGWENIQTGEKIIGKKTNEALNRLAFSGIQVIDPAIFKHMHKPGAFSIIETYLELAGNAKIDGYIDDHNVWIDVGTPEKLRQGEEYLKEIE
jgi:NDP-sugar pyrophosphorylase family protein